LKDKGHLIILVPSYKALYNGFDKELDKQYFNFMGIFGWFVSGQLMRNKSIPEGQMKLFNIIIPISRIIDNIIFNLLGLSTIVVGRK